MEHGARSARRDERDERQKAQGARHKAKEREFRIQRTGEQNIWHGEEKDQRSELRRH
jgi:hypothetical protein